ncbi:hypothetical protein K7X08_007866 [Anisodus acutangulus]|uniref:Uncharacterized protein n=1 Tax=Anisodus acutangulus TaxID=402998 RepID=A0A9Q1MPI5_9SOLA|nr:hypothetical protein K7X08_007866 [Anisodus acutangulus]
MVEKPQVVSPLLEYVRHVEGDNVVSIDKGTGQDIGDSEGTSTAFDDVLEAPFEATPHVQNVAESSHARSAPDVAESEGLLVWGCCTHKVNKLSLMLDCQVKGLETFNLQH